MQIMSEISMKLNRRARTQPQACLNGTNEREIAENGSE